MDRFSFSIQTGTPTPIWQQITRQLRLAIYRGELQPGDALPSVRALAETLVVNANTVVKAYGDLQRSGELVSQQGRGVTVAARRQRLSDAERQHRLAEAAESFIHAGVEAGVGPDELRAALHAQLTRLQISA